MLEKRQLLLCNGGKYGTTVDYSDWKIEDMLHELVNMAKKISRQNIASTN